MGSDRIVAEGESLRRAIRWLGENPPVTPARINEAACRFDLSPIDEEFLLRDFRAPPPTPDNMES